MKAIDIAINLKENFPDFDFGDLDCCLWCDMLQAKPPRKIGFQTLKKEDAHIVDYAICFIRQNRFILCSVSLEFHSLQTFILTIGRLIPRLTDFNDREKAYELYLAEATLVKNIVRRGSCYEDFSVRSREKDWKSEYFALSDDDLKELLEIKDVSLLVNRYTMGVLAETGGNPTALDRQKAIEKFKSEYPARIRQIQEGITDSQFVKPLESVNDQTIDLKTRKQVSEVLVQVGANKRYNDLLSAFEAGLKANLEVYESTSGVSSSFRLGENLNSGYARLYQKVTEKLKLEDEELDGDPKKTQWRDYGRITRVPPDQLQEYLDSEVTNARQEAQKLQQSAEVENELAKKAEESFQKSLSEFEHVTSSENETLTYKKIMESTKDRASEPAIAARTKAEEAQKRADGAKEDLIEKLQRAKAFRNDFSDISPEDFTED